MKTFSAILILIFYLFFFLRAGILKKKIKQSIKAKDMFLNVSIISAGLASILFLLQIFINEIHKYLFITYQKKIMDIFGLVLIAIGLVGSSIASLGLGKSWRIGVNNQTKTGLITHGIYSFSRNPYFLFYDISLIGIAISSSSLIIIGFSILTIILFHNLIIKEELYLEEVHGDEYTTYKRKVHRYI